MCFFFAGFTPHRLLTGPRAPASSLHTLDGWWFSTFFSARFPTCVHVVCHRTLCCRDTAYPFIGEDPEAQGGWGTCPGRGCPRDEVWVPYLQGSFGHTQPAFFPCPWYVSESVFSCRLPLCPARPLPPWLLEPAGRTGLLLLQPFAVTTGVGPSSPGPDPLVWGGVAGESAPPGSQGGSVGCSYRDVKCLCCQGAWVSHCIKWTLGTYSLWQEISCCPPPLSCQMPRLVALPTPGDTVWISWVPSLRRWHCLGTLFSWGQEALTLDSSIWPSQGPGPCFLVCGENLGLGTPSVFLCK